MTTPRRYALAIATKEAARAEAQIVLGRDATVIGVRADGPHYYVVHAVRDGRYETVRVCRATGAVERPHQ